MLTVLVTCLVLASATFTPPAGWEILKIVGGRHEDSLALCVNLHGAVRKCDEAPYNRTQVHLRREIKPGEIIDLPQGCTVSVEAPKD